MGRGGAKMAEEAGLQEVRAGGNGPGRGLVGYRGQGGGTTGASSLWRRGWRRVPRRRRQGAGPGKWWPGAGPAARAGPVLAAARRGATKMAASGWARAAVVLLCASELLLLLLLPLRAFAAEGPAETPGEATPPLRKKKKDIRDYNDADMARLLEQWEVRGARTPSRLFSVPGPFPVTSHLLRLGTL